MSYSLTGTSSSHNNEMVDEALGSRPIKCVSNLPIKKGGMSLKSLFPETFPSNGKISDLRSYFLESQKSYCMVQKKEKRDRS